MPNLVQTYVVHDSEKNRGGMFRINRNDAAEWNSKGYGIFQTVNEFHGKRRIENLVHINAWMADMDSGTKPEMLERLSQGLLPTMIVETKRGYQAYWKAKDASKENWKLIMENRILPFYQADKNAKDLARVLRVPGFYHLKEPSDPFLVRKVHYAHVEYTERQMMFFFKDEITKKKQMKLHRSAMKMHPMAGNFWDNVWGLNCEYALQKLSGSEHVGGEIFSFRENNAGTKQIYVNGKSTSCWIDNEGRIGSSDSGGPTIAQWLNWYHKDYQKVVEIIKGEFPECMKTELQLTLI